jgi:hypothetical protein
MVTVETKYAGFWLRFWADFIDSMLLDFFAILSVLAMMGAIYWARLMFLGTAGTVGWSWAQSMDSFWMQGAVVLGRAVFSLFYFTFLTSRFGTTLGKSLFRIYVVSVETQERLSLYQSMLRCFAYLGSYLTGGIGFLMGAIHPEKRCLHDLIAGTICIVK